MNYRIFVFIIVYLVFLHCSKNPQNNDNTNDKTFTDKNPGLDTTLSFMTFNMSIGFSVQNLLTPGINLSDTLTVLQEGKDMYQQYKTSNAEARIDKLADSIVAISPEVIALQEVLFMRNAHTKDTLDFLPRLLENITSKGGANYQFAAQKLNQIPIMVWVKNDTLRDSLDILFYEGNAILYKPTLTLVSSTSLIFDAYIPISFLDTLITISRGVQYIQLQSGDSTLVNVFNTHLEVLSFISGSQATQLIGYINSLPLKNKTQIIMGDFNDKPTGSIITKIIGENFLDTYQHVNQDSGFTCCTSLIKPFTQPSQRIDYIFAKTIVRVGDAGVVLNGDFTGGDGNQYRISDHLGVLSTITFH